MKSLVIVLLAIILSGNLFHTYSWDTTAAKYMPLQIGNTWVYSTGYSSFFGSGSAFERYRITGTQSINGKIYYVLNHTHIQINGNYSCSSRLFSGDYPIRIDSINMNLYKNTVCGSSSEAMVDSLASKFGDSSITCPNLLGSKTALNDTSDFFIFNSYFDSKRFTTVNINGGIEQTYLKGIGVVRYYSSVASEVCNIYLKGCIINGVVYGDTSIIVGINIISSEIPDKFELSQNYPNPFNPVTNIKFDIPNTPSPSGRVGVGLIIYDVLGKEVQTLVNEHLSPGTYEVDFDGSNLPSGVYYYKLVVGDNINNRGFVETRKMILLK